jgi:methylmalonyl-CoA/ethylmalonyl-CoA epimerase
METVKKVNHVAIVVRDIDSALEFWNNALGIPLDHVEEVPSQQAKVAFLPVGGSEIELVQPTNSDSGMASFLEKRGEGLHHVCVEVSDIDAMLAQLKRAGVRLINETAQILPGRKMAFVHPKSANGVLIELYELTDSE